MQRLAAIAAFAALVAVSGGVWYASQRNASGDPYAQCRTSRIAGGAEQIGGPFTLVNKSGETVTDKEVIKEPSLVYFGYTFCPDVCPFDTARNAEAVDVLTERGYSVTPVFISIDPDRDTPEVVGEFAELVHERMIGLTGSPEQVKAASQAYRTYYRKQEDGDPEYYLVDHSTFTYLVLPEVGFVDFFRREVTPEEMADRVACYINAS
ncbi:SCO family protein [Antarctobacter sp.]|uniref:SCO family protein n=1 Tax=Antarctobacter sp. TaxID=1872577 RepID=UPI002B264E72|nr:SCO family protein [Antarctobacter sp.]